MRFGCSAGRALLWQGEFWVDVHRESGGQFGPHPSQVFDHWTAFRAWARTFTGPGQLVDVVRWDPPSPLPRQVLAVGANYAAHAEEIGLVRDRQVVVFSKFPSCLVGDGASVPLVSHTVDWEVELVVVMGLAAYRVPTASAWDFVAGLTVGQDLTDRHVQLGEPGRQFSLSKSFPGAGPVGPFLVTPDEFSSPDDLALGCAFSGEAVQSARTSSMLRSVPELVSEISGHVQLQPGDLIFTGSPQGSGHARVPSRYLAPGLLTSWVEGVGTLSVSFTDRPAQ